MNANWIAILTLLVTASAHAELWPGVENGSVVEIDAKKCDCYKETAGDKNMQKFDCSTDPSLKLRSFIINRNNTKLCGEKMTENLVINSEALGLRCLDPKRLTGSYRATGALGTNGVRQREEKFTIYPIGNSYIESFTEKILVDGKTQSTHAAFREIRLDKNRVVHLHIERISNDSLSSEKATKLTVHCQGPVTTPAQ